MGNFAMKQAMGLQKPPSHKLKAHPTTKPKNDENDGGDCFIESITPNLHVNSSSNIRFASSDSSYNSWLVILLYL